MLLTFLGDIKYFTRPPILVYHPVTFKAKGSLTRQAINLLEPGDLILRGYDCYVDGFFIPGTYSHTGIYVGDNQMIHAIAEGVEQCDIIDFLRCDRFCILRPDGDKLLAIERAKIFLEEKTPYDFDFVSGNKALYCHELGAMAYEELEVPKMIPALFYGLIKGQPAYLADSFLNSEHFVKVFEFLPGNKAPRCFRA